MKLGPLDDDDWPTTIADMRTGFAGRLNVYRTMAHHPALLKAWADLRDHIVVRTTLGREGSEVVILRTGHRLDSAYEWAHHVARSRACGMKDARIESIRGPLESMSANDRMLAGAVDELLDAAQLSPATVRGVAAIVGREGVFDLMATVGFYSTLAFILKTFDVPIDSDLD